MSSVKPDLDRPDGGLLDLIKARRSVRRYTAQRIPEADLLRLVEAGRWAPSGSNRQPWTFVAVDDPEQLEALQAFAPGIIGRPAAVIAVCIDGCGNARDDGDEDLPPMDAAMAAQNILLEAAALAIGSCPVLSYDAPSVSRLLGLPEEVRLELLIALGYPAGPARVPRRRRTMAQVAHRNRFGRPFEGAAAWDGDGPK